MTDRRKPAAPRRRSPISLNALLSFAFCLVIGLAMKFQIIGLERRLPAAPPIDLSDELTVEIAGEIPGSTHTVKVMADGTVLLPHLGKASAAGQSLDEFAGQLLARYEALYARPGHMPTVNVSVTFSQPTPHGRAP